MSLALPCQVRAQTRALITRQQERASLSSPIQMLSSRPICLQLLLLFLLRSISANKTLERRRRLSAIKRPLANHHCRPVGVAPVATHYLWPPDLDFDQLGRRRLAFCSSPSKVVAGLALKQVAGREWRSSSASLPATLIGASRRRRSSGDMQMGL